MVGSASRRVRRLRQSRAAPGTLSASRLALPAPSLRRQPLTPPGEPAHPPWRSRRSQGPCGRLRQHLQDALRRRLDFGPAIRRAISKSSRHFPAHCVGDVGFGESQGASLQHRGGLKSCQDELDRWLLSTGRPIAWMWWRHSSVQRPTPVPPVPGPLAPPGADRQQPVRRWRCDHCPKWTTPASTASSKMEMAAAISDPVYDDVASRWECEEDLKNVGRHEAGVCVVRRTCPCTHYMWSTSTMRAG